MYLTTYEPRSLFNQLQRDVNRLFDGDSASSSWSPAVDIREYDDQFVLRADLPGIALADVEITVDNNVLTVAGERKLVADDDSGQAHRVERAQGAFSRQFKLPETVDVDKVSAKGENGVVQITLPKAEQVKPRRIEVQ